MEVLKLETWERLFDPEVVSLDKVQEYLDFIVEARDRYYPERYSEWHHVMPKCIDKNRQFNDEGVRIQARDHYTAHKMLVTCFNGTLKSKLSYALMRMTHSKDGQYCLTEEDYEFSKAVLSDSQRGSNNPCFGRVMSEDERKRRSESHRRENLSPEVRKKISEGTSGSNNGMYGKKHSSETLQKISQSLKGRKMPRDTVNKVSEDLRNMVWVNDGDTSSRVLRSKLDEFLANNPSWSVGRGSLKRGGTS